MDVEDRDAEARCLNAGSGHGVGDIVILQIEKDAAAARDNLSDHVGPGRGEKLHADLECADMITQLFEQL